jgi:hypothetical protein
VLIYRDQLADTPRALTEADKIAHLITSLPESCHVTESILTNQPIINMTLDHVILSLNNHELQLQQHIVNNSKPITNVLIAITEHRRG